MKQNDKMERIVMKKIGVFPGAVLVAGVICAEVTISNLNVAQRPGTKLVDITYDVSSKKTEAVTTQMTVSNGTAEVPATNLTGDVGYRVTAGTNKETGVTWPHPRFTVVTNGPAQTVIDNLTGLEWIKAPHALSGNSGPTSWKGAIDRCNNLVYAGHSDWRLPSVKELESLVSCGTATPALPEKHPFAGVRSNYYWSGTSNASSTVFAWNVDMDNGFVYSYSKSDSLYVWPVRGGQQENLIF